MATIANVEDVKLPDESASAHSVVQTATVEAAISRLESSSPFEREKAAVPRPRTSVRPKKVGVIPQGILLQVAIPAITRVQEWSSELTGVGPSIASGNQRAVIPETDFNIKARSSRLLGLTPKASSVASEKEENC